MSARPHWYGPMRHDGTNFLWLVVANWLLATIIFIGDLLVPLGIAGGVLYAAVVLVAVWLSGTQVYVFAVCCTILIVVGSHIAHGESVAELLANRLLGIFAIWLVALLGLRARRLADGMVQQARIIDEAREGIVVVDRAGQITFSNKGAETIFGYSNRDLLGRPISFLFPGDDGNDLHQMLIEGLDSAEAFELNLKGVRRGGEQFLAKQWFVRRYDEEGEESGLVLHLVDVSKQTSPAEAARRVEIFYRDLLDKLPLQVAPFDALGRFLYLNPASLSSPIMRDWIIGRTEREYFEKQRRNMTAMEHRELQFKRAVAEKQPINFDETFQAKSGESRCFSHGFFPIVDSTGEVTRVLGFRYDITDHRIAELQLSESLARLKGVFDTAGEGIMTIDHEGAIETANAAALNLLGYTRDEIRHVNINDVLLLCDTNEPDTRSATDILQTWRMRTAENSEIYARRRGGETFPAELTVTDLELGDRRLYTTILRDITDRRRSEIALQRYNDRLEGLRRIDRTILTAQSPRSVAEVVGRHLLQIISADRVSVHIVDDSDEIASTLTVLADGTTRHDSTLTDPYSSPADHYLDTTPVTQDKRDEPDHGAAYHVQIIEYEESRIDVLLRAQGSFIGILAIESTSMEAFEQSDVEIIRDVAGLLAVALHDARLFEQVDSSRDRLQTLSRRLVNVQEEERRRLARELHDEIGQALTGLKLSLEAADRQAESPHDSSLDEAKDIVRYLLGRVRNLSLDLRPAMLDDLGLVPAVVWLIDRFERQTKIQIDFKHAVNDRFDTDTETAAYRIVQEALTNVARHSQVGQAAVLITTSNHELVITVKDEGVGFDLRLPTLVASRSGLSGIQERVGLLQGELVIETAPGKGTCLTATLPIA